MRGGVKATQADRTSAAVIATYYREFPWNTTASSNKYRTDSRQKNDYRHLTCTKRIPSGTLQHHSLTTYSNNVVLLNAAWLAGKL